MTVKLLFFGVTADMVGSSTLELAADYGTTATSLIDQLFRDYPRLANYKLLIAVNEEYSAADRLLNDGDVVALFTAVSGG